MRDWNYDMLVIRLMEIGCNSKKNCVGSSCVEKHLLSLLQASHIYLRKIIRINKTEIFKMYILLNYDTPDLTASFTSQQNNNINMYMIKRRSKLAHPPSSSLHRIY